MEEESQTRIKQVGRRFDGGRAGGMGTHRRGSGMTPEAARPLPEPTHTHTRWSPQAATHPTRHVLLSYTGCNLGYVEHGTLGPRGKHGNKVVATVQGIFGQFSSLSKGAGGTPARTQSQP